MGKFTIFDFLRVRHDLDVLGDMNIAGKINAANMPKTVKGSFKYNTSGIATKASTGISLPKGAIVTRVAVNVTTAFNAGTSNNIELGYSSDTDALMADDVATAGTVGTYVKERMDAALTSNSVVYAKYAQTGTAATAGAADVYVTYIESL